MTLKRYWVIFQTLLDLIVGLFSCQSRDENQIGLYLDGSCFMVTLIRCAIILFWLLNHEEQMSCGFLVVKPINLMITDSLDNLMNYYMINWVFLITSY